MDTQANLQVIFSAVLIKGENFLERRTKLISSFTDDSMFTNEFYVLFDIIRAFPTILPNEAFVDMFMRTNRAKYSTSQQIDLNAYRLGDTDPYAEFAQSVIAILKECLATDVDEADYHMAIEMHKMVYLHEHSLTILEKSATVLSEGLQSGSKGIGGYEEMRRTLNKEFSRLDNISAKKNRKGLILYGADDEEETNSGKMHLVTRFNVEQLDKNIGGIYQGDMVSILAPAKGCKTRFVTMVLHTAIVSGTPVAMFPVENGAKGFEALLRARHFEWMYNRHVTDPTKLMFLDSDMIRKGELTGKLADLELASWTDLKTNSNYGKFTVIDEDFHLETFLSHFKLAIDTIGAQLICADYLQLMGSLNPNMAKHDRISQAYIQTLQFLKSEKVGGIFPGQLKQSAVGEIGKAEDDDLSNMELRDAAGESYEVIKTPDVNIALYGTVESIRRGNMKIISIPSRNVAPYEPIDLHVNAGTCTFASVEKVE